MKPAVGKCLAWPVGRRKKLARSAIDVNRVLRETFRQATPGPPTERTRYVKRTQPAYALSWELQHAALVEAECGDGVFPF